MNDMNEIAASAADRTAVRITAVECIPLNVPFKVPFKISTGAARPVVETLIVKVHTDQGVTGVGETQAWRRQGSAETLEGQINVIKNHFEPQMIGRSPFDVNAIMHGLNESMYHSHYSQAAVGDALYDAVGKNTRHARLSNSGRQDSGQGPGRSCALDERDGRVTPGIGG